MIRSSRRPATARPLALAAFAGLLALFLAACGGAAQYDPPGQNSGSPQNAPGAFNFDTTREVKGAVGTPVDVYDAFTTVTMAFTVTNTALVTQSANQNAASGTITIPDGEQFLEVDVALKNLSAGPNGCPFPGAEAQTPCTEFPNPLTSFRMVDNQSRTWPTTTGAAEQCSDQTQAANKGVNCAIRDWFAMLGLNDANGVVPTGGIQPGATFNGKLFYLIPTNVHTFDLFYAPYRFPEVRPTAAGAPTATPIGAGATTGTGKATPTPTVAPAGQATPNPGSVPPTAEPILADITINV